MAKVDHEEESKRTCDEVGMSCVVLGTGWVTHVLRATNLGVTARHLEVHQKQNQELKARLVQSRGLKMPGAMVAWNPQKEKQRDRDRWLDR